MTRPAPLLAVLVGLHLGAQRLIVGHVVLVLSFVAVAAFEVADRSAARRSRRHLSR